MQLKLGTLRHSCIFKFKKPENDVEIRCFKNCPVFFAIFFLVTLFKTSFYLEDSSTPSTINRVQII